MGWFGRLGAVVVLVVGIVVSPLPTMAATVPPLLAYDTAARSTATTGGGAYDAVRSEPERASISAYDCGAAVFGYDDCASLRMSTGAGAALAYDGRLEHAHRGGVRPAGAIYDDPTATAAAEGITNQVPSALARVIPGKRAARDVGAAVRADVFVTAAEDIAGMTPGQIARRLTIAPSNSFTVLKSETPAEVPGSPILRSDPGSSEVVRPLVGPGTSHDACPGAARDGSPALSNRTSSVE